mmetsp:Transcript_25787/g.76764  ORF Transcript_25787/g.76764 Transcript_25787/m.76764 type:complete len:511 (+) Transcript_25787:757-2289(+)
MALGMATATPVHRSTRPTERRGRSPCRGCSRRAARRRCRAGRRRRCRWPRPRRRSCARGSRPSLARPTRPTRRSRRSGATRRPGSCRSSSAPRARYRQPSTGRRRCRTCHACRTRACAPRGPRRRARRGRGQAGAWRRVGRVRHGLGIGKVRHRPALARGRVDRVGLERVSLARAARVKVEERRAGRMVLVGVAARVELRRLDRAAVVAPVDHPAERLRAPAAAAVQRAGVAPMPVVADPPAVRVLRVRAVAVAVRVELVRVGGGAVRKVGVAEAALGHPPCLGQDAAEPAAAAAVDRPVEVRRLDALGGARRGERIGAGAVGQHGRRRRAVVVAAARGVVLPRRAGVVFALLARPVGGGAVGAARARLGRIRRRGPGRRHRARGRRWGWRWGWRRRRLCIARPDQLSVVAAARAAGAVGAQLGGGAEPGAGVAADGRGLDEGLALVAVAHLWPVRLGPHVAAAVLAPPAAQVRVGAAAHLVLLARVCPPRVLRAAPGPAALDLAARRAR